MPNTASVPAPIRDSWLPHLALGVTGHRAANPAYHAHAAAIAAALEALFARIDAICADLPGTRGPVRLHSLLVDGTDQVAGERALARGWDLAVPLPFGAMLNGAINAHPRPPRSAPSPRARACSNSPTVTPQSRRCGARTSPPPKTAPPRAPSMRWCRTMSHSPGA